MLKVGIIIGSTRPNRVGEGVARWVYEEATKRTDAEFELVDIRSFNLPLLDEPTPPGSAAEYVQPHTRAWGQKIASFDAFIFVTPEYNHGIAGAMKNAIDFLYKEWNDKVAGFVGYGSVGGTRSVEHLRGVMGELQVATVRGQVVLNLRTDFENYKVPKPNAHHVKTLKTVIEQVIRWGTALKAIRTGELRVPSFPEKHVERSGAALQ